MRPEGRIVGCILAGGNSSRMGRDKSLLTFGSASMIARTVTTLREVFSTVVIVSDRHAEYEFLRVPVLPDIEKNCGPLGGIQAAFVQTQADHLFVLACDMPFVSPELIRYIIAESRATVTVPMMNGKVHPVCGLYSKSCLPIVEESLSRGMHRLQDILKTLNATIISLTSDLPCYRPNMLDNLNDPDDLERALHLQY